MPKIGSNSEKGNKWIGRRPDDFSVPARLPRTLGGWLLHHRRGIPVSRADLLSALLGYSGEAVH